MRASATGGHTLPCASPPRTSRTFHCWGIASPTLPSRRCPSRLFHLGPHLLQSSGTCRFSSDGPFLAGTPAYSMHCYELMSRGGRGEEDYAARYDAPSPPHQAALSHMTFDRCPALPTPWSDSTKKGHAVLDLEGHDGWMDKMDKMDEMDEMDGWVGACVSAPGTRECTSLNLSCGGM